ncbi:putative cystathionine gamma-lyase 2 [Dysidea avara]|uniref:putative cystathionine gamma-lyase 2 n=1 Tax=Dysidea avara TaxID=196820 RepID=UPI00331E53C8
MSGQPPSKKQKVEQDAETFPGFATAVIHAGQEPEQWASKSVVPLISLSTTFKQDTPANPDPYEYTRGGNPSRTVLQTCLAASEGAEYAYVASSGLAATSLIIQTLKSGDHMVTMNDLYGGTNRYFRRVVSKFGITASFVDCTDLTNLKAAIQPNTKIVWIESPTNPTLRIVDIRGAAEIAHKHPGILLVVDNTFMSPYFQRPLELGADIVMHSITKYINGHSDVLMGVICTNNKEFGEQINFLQLAVGSVPSPFDCYLVNRGLKTLHLRMRQHEKNAMAVAKYLESSSCVKEVLYPGLPSHPQHEVAKKQCKGFSGMVSFRIKGDLQTSREFFKALKVFTLAESLGGYESLAELPAVMTHASVSEEERKALGITDTLIRLSVGLESIDDLINDLDQALQHACQQS